MLDEKGIALIICHLVLVMLPYVLYLRPAQSFHIHHLQQNILLQ